MVAAFQRGEGEHKVEVACQTCQKPFLRRQKALAKPLVCRSCHRISWWKTRATPALPDVSHVLHATETERRFGYSLSVVRPTSFLRVVGTCTDCGQLFERIRRNVNLNTRCRSCGVQAGQTQEAVAKRRATMLERYGATGLPYKANAYGATEDEIAALIAQWADAEPVRQRPLATGQSLDIYVPSRELALEYGGLHWHHELSPTPRDRRYHADKAEAARREGIRLVTLFEDEWRHHRHAAEGVLKALFGGREQRLGARACDLVEVPPAEARAFMDHEHLQGGSRRAHHAWGLRAQGKLVAALTVAPHHRQGHGNVLVLDRLCFANGVQVIGGAARLISAATAFAKAAGAEKLVSWSDDRWSDGGVYARNGFTLAAKLSPDYTYVTVAKPRERISKQSQRKAKTHCPPDKTEVQWAHERGLARLWDCGHRRWEIVLRDA